MLERGIQSNVFQSSLSRQYSSKLRDGQVFFAKVNKLLPEGMAEIQYNGVKAVAKLEAPLTTGTNYFFQVEIGDGDPLKLKVISAPATEAKPSLSTLAEKLMNDLQLPKSSNIKDLVTAMVRNSFPFSKEEMILMNDLLSNSADKKAGLEVLLKLKTENIPVSKPLYWSILHGKSMEPLSTMMDHLADALQKSVNEPREAGNILRILAGMKEIEGSKVFQKVAVGASDILMNADLEDTPRKAALQLLQLMGVLPKKSSLETAAPFLNKEGGSIQRLGEMMNTSSGPVQVKDKLLAVIEVLSKVQLQGDKNQAILSEMQSVLKGTESGGRITPEWMKQGTDLIRQAEILLLQKGADHSLNDGEKFNVLLGIHSGREKQLLTNFSGMVQRLQQQGVPDQTAMKLLDNILNSEGGLNSLHKDLPDIVKAVLDKLGVNHEARLASDSPVERSYRESLKPALIALLKDLPQGEMREAAEKLLFKLNGHSILSGESGPLQQVICQFPLSWLHQRTDVTMQWAGRKMQNGQVDPGYCRVLFYLELENINEVIIDMAVQNRVVTLNIYNDTPHLKKVSAPFTSLMKEGLENIQYKLSAINFRNPGTADPVKKVYQELAGEEPYTGVDLRV